MASIMRGGLAAACLFGLAFVADAGPAAACEGVGCVGKAIGQGVGGAGAAIGEGASAAARGVEKGAHGVGVGVEKGVNATGKALGDAGRGVDRAVTGSQ